MKTDFSAVILSAGFSSRMHAFKPLLQIGGLPVVGRLVNLFYQAGLTEIIVVVGHRHCEIEDYLKTLPAEIRRFVKLKYNPIFEQGMYTSVQAGVSEVSADKSGFFILPVDYPLVGNSVLGELMKFWCNGKLAETEVVYPVYKNRRGHPPLLSTELISEIITKEQKTGLRSFLQNHQNRAENLPVEDESILWDMDKKEDYIRLSEVYAKFNR
ncbi:MAG: nucleotidyltransferase family protein [Bacillota bacterium]|jgi:molybdenum cofactor cytidylyltransferase